MRATAEPSLGPTPTTAAMPLEELEPDTDLRLSMWSARREGEKGREEGEARLGERPAPTVLLLLLGETSKQEAPVHSVRLGDRMEKGGCPLSLGFSVAFNSPAATRIGSRWIQDSKEDK